MNSRYLLPEVTELDKVPQNSELEEYQNQAKPWVARGALSENDRDPFRLEMLRESCADWSLRVQKQGQFVDLGLRKYVDDFELSATEVGYAQQQQVPTPVHQLESELPLPPCHFPTNFWLGPKGARTNLHRDVYHNVVAQLDGRKQFVLLSPADNRQVYVQRISSNSANKSPVANALAPDLTRFPRFRDASPIKIILEPGDVLYIPPYWWHEAVAITHNVMINRWKRPSLELVAVGDFQEMFNDSYALLNVLVTSADLQSYEDDYAIAEWLNSVGLSLASIIVLGEIVKELLAILGYGASLVPPLGNFRISTVSVYLQYKEKITNKQKRVCMDCHNMVLLASDRLGEEFPGFFDVQNMIDRVREFQSEAGITKCTPICTQNEVVMSMLTNTYISI